MSANFLLNQYPFSNPFIFNKNNFATPQMPNVFDGFNFNCSFANAFSASAFDFSNFNFKGTIQHLEIYHKGSHTNLNGETVLIMLSQYKSNTSTNTSQAASLEHSSKNSQHFTLVIWKKMYLRKPTVAYFVNRSQS